MPSCASLLAAARPIPLVPPVTSAVNELAIFARTGFSQNRAEVHSRKHLLKSARAAPLREGTESRLQLYRARALRLPEGPGGAGCPTKLAARICRKSWWTERR